MKRDLNGRLGDLTAALGELERGQGHFSAALKNLRKAAEYIGTLGSPELEAAALNRVGCARPALAVSRTSVPVTEWVGGCHQAAGWVGARVGRRGLSTHPGDGAPRTDPPHRRFVGDASCTAQPEAVKRRAVDAAWLEYNRRFRKVAAEFEAKQEPGFAVSVQPFMEGLGWQGPEYLSALDCFHPTQISHAYFALGLWNNMQQKAGHKTTYRQPETAQYLCPGPDTFIS